MGEHLRDPIRHYTDTEHDRALERLNADLKRRPSGHPSAEPRVIRQEAHINIEKYAEDGWPRPESDCEL